MSTTPPATSSETAGTSKRSRKRPAPVRRRRRAAAVPIVVSPVEAPHAEDKPNWMLRVGWVAAAIVGWMYFNAHFSNKHKPADTTPDTPAVAVAMYDEVAPCFPEGADEQAREYGAWFEANVDKAQRYGKPVSPRTREAVRKAYGLDNPDLSKIVEAKMEPFKTIGDAPWTAAQLSEFCATFHALSEACLASSVD